jgi:hypothetical protein
MAAAIHPVTSPRAGFAVRESYGQPSSYPPVTVAIRYGILGKFMYYCVQVGLIFNCHRFLTPRSRRPTRLKRPRLKAWQTVVLNKRMHILLSGSTIWPLLFSNLMAPKRRSDGIGRCALGDTGIIVEKILAIFYGQRSAIVLPNTKHRGTLHLDRM